MADGGDADAAAAAARVLVDGTRGRLLLALADGETTVSALQARLGLPQPLASFHLAKLRVAGLVRARRDRQWVYYALDPDGLAAARAAITRVLDPTCEAETSQTTRI